MSIFDRTNNDDKKKMDDYRNKVNEYMEKYYKNRKKRKARIRPDDLKPRGFIDDIIKKKKK